MIKECPYTLFTTLYLGAMVLHSDIYGVKLIMLFQKSAESLPHRPTYNAYTNSIAKRVFLAKTSLQDIFTYFIDILANCKFRVFTTDIEEMGKKWMTSRQNFAKFSAVVVCYIMKFEIELVRLSHHDSRRRLNTISVMHKQ